MHWRVSVTVPAHAVERFTPMAWALFSTGFSPFRGAGAVCGMPLVEGYYRGEMWLPDRPQAQLATDTAAAFLSVAPGSDVRLEFRSEGSDGRVWQGGCP